MLSSAPASETGPGVIIYTTLDNGRDETAIAVPFVKAEQFALVTNVTTADGKSIRITNNQLKQIVRPPDLSRLTVVDEAGLQSVRARAKSLRDLQKRFPRAASALDGIAGEIDRTAQVFESGNVLVEGRVVPRTDYDRQVAAARGRSIAINLNGRDFKGAKLSSVGDGKVSITHAGGVASVPLDSLSDEAIAQLNGTSTGPLIEKPKPVAPAAASAPPQPIAATPSKPEKSQPALPPTSVRVTAPPASSTVSASDARPTATTPPTSAPLTVQSAPPPLAPPAAAKAVPATTPLPGQVPAPVLTLPSRGLPTIPFIVAGLLAFGATAVAFMVRNRRDRIFVAPCPSCGEEVSIDRATTDTTLACPYCEYEFTVGPSTGGQHARQPSTPGPWVYGGVAAGSLLLLVGLFVHLERATVTPKDLSHYVVSDYPAELQDLRQRAESGETTAQYELGRFHDKGTDDFPADPREAALWYLTAAEGGDATAQLAIGTLYDMGLGIAPDPQEAERWLTAAAEQGVVEAQKILGVLYLGKASLPYEPERSIQWMTRAAEQGDGEAMFHLSIAYHKGVEVAPDPEASERWLQRAVEADFGPAKEILRLRQANLEAQVDQLWRQVEDSMPRSSGFYTNPYTQNIPPQYR